MTAPMHDRLGVNAICFLDADLSEAETIWRDLGPRRISLTNRQLRDEDIDRVRALIAAGNYQVDAVSHVFHWGPLPQQAADWSEPRAALSTLIDKAAAIGARSVYFLTGGRGALGWEDGVAMFSEAIAPCVAHAREAGISLATENTLPLYVDHHLATNLRDAVTLVERAGIGLCIDIYAGWTEAGLRATIERATPRTVLVQVSDYILGDKALPNRSVPGDGVIPLERIIGHILAAGYQGGFDLEILGPRIVAEGPRDALRRAGAHVSTILDTLGA